MDEVKVKAHNQTYYVHCMIDHSDDFFDLLIKRLQACSRGMDRCFEAFFIFSRSLTKDEILKLFHILKEQNVEMLGISYPEKVKKMNIVSEPLYSGQTYHYDEETLLLGSVCQDTFITCSQNLYIVGEVRGNIDLLHEDCCIHAGNFRNANIRICDSSYQNMTSFSPAKIYYSDMNLKLKEFKEERVWEKQLQ